ncbi:glutamate receptor 1.2-like protein [Tanacetum coccineum]
MLSKRSNLWIILIFSTLHHGLCVDVGIVLDMKSWVGKSIHSTSSITIAISDFYAHNDHYVTRIVVHTRDSKGDPLQTMLNGKILRYDIALELLNTFKVSAIIGPEVFIGSKLVASITDKAKVPVFSFAGKSSAEYPYFFQLKEDETNMAKSIAALVGSFKWRDVIYVYEDNDDQGEDILQY